MRRGLILISAMSLLAAITLTPVFAHCEYCDNNVTIIHGEPVVTVGVPALQIKTDNGFEVPVLGETHEDEILYNIPSDGSDPVPLREVPTLYITDGELPVVIDESISEDYTTRGLVYPGNPNPITLGDWIKGDRSKLKIQTLENGMSKVNMKIKGLLPNSLYGVWQVNLAGGLPGPFGGIPNVFVTDAKGNATMKRTLPFNANKVIDSLLVLYHSDHHIYGGTPTLAPAGNDAHVQLKFEVNAAQ